MMQLYIIKNLSYYISKIKSTQYLFQIFITEALLWTVKIERWHVDNAEVSEQRLGEIPADPLAQSMNCWFLIIHHYHCYRNCYLCQ